MRYVAEGHSNVEVDFNFGNVQPLPGYPTATLLDDQEYVVGIFQSVISINNSEIWTSTITVPTVEGNEQKIWTVRWTIVTSDRESTFDVPIYTKPNISNQTGDVVQLQGQLLAFTLPYLVTTADVDIYRFNELIKTVAVQLIDIVQLLDSSHVTVTITEIPPSITAYLVVVNNNFIFNLWIVTPRMLSAIMAIDSWINKARVEQIIPQLEYKQSDLMNYLERGLNLLNSYGVQLTSFNGLNMQGPIYECWILCATYYALGAQLQAEGAMTFDFSGQAINLNVDRTAQIEGALGRVEGMINEKVPAIKKLLVKYGITGGDGSQSLSKLNPVGLGRVGITSSASNVGNANNFNRSMYRVYG